MFRTRLLNSLRFSVRNASSHAHAPAKPVDLNIALEGVEARWGQLAQEQKDVVAQKARELMKGDWKSLSLSQKKTLYFVAFRSNEFPPTEVGKVVAGVTMLTAVSLAVFAFFRMLGPADQRTMTQEWKEAENEFMRQNKLNPITGVSSEGYKGKGMASALYLK